MTNMCDDCANRDDCGIRDRLLDTEDDTGVKLQVNYCPEYRNIDAEDDDEFPQDALDSLPSRDLW